MSMQKHIEEAESVLLHTYNRYPVVFDHGDGVYLFDEDGKKYLDFVAGISVFALGYNNKEYNDALKNQIDKIIHTSNYYYNVPAIEAAKKSVEESAAVAEEADRESPLSGDVDGIEDEDAVLLDEDDYADPDDAKAYLDEDISISFGGDEK